MNDTVDDLHHAEDHAGALAHALRALLDPSPDPAAFRDARSTARAHLGNFATYCRPTCGWRTEGECSEGDTCGCLCDHVLPPDAGAA